MSQALLKSINSIQVISNYLSIQTLQSYNLLNHQFYDKIVPEVMRNRRLYPCIQNEQHLFIKDNALWSLQITNTTALREIDFEDDKWRHDDQFEITAGSNTKPKKLFDFKSLGQGSDDAELKIADDEEVLPQYVHHLNAYRYLIFPLKEALFINRGLIIDINPWEEMRITKTAPPPERLLRSGISLQKTHGRVTDILCVGGNEDKRCYHLNIEQNKWTKHGALP